MADPDNLDAAEAHAANARKQMAALNACKDIVMLLSAESVPVLAGAASALFNLALDSANAEALHSLGAMQQLHMLVSHENTDVAGAVAGVLMNCCASSSQCRSELESQGLLSTLLPLVASAQGDQAETFSNVEFLSRLLGALNNLLLHMSAAVQQLWSLCGGHLVVTLT